MEEVGKKFDFAKRRVLITGGGRGMGKVAAKAFARLNATVFVIDKEEDSLKLLKTELAEVVTILVDLTDWKAVEEEIAKILPIHHLVNNAAILGGPTPLLTLTEEDYNTISNVNLKAVIRVAQVVARGMIKDKVEGGTIVNMSSLTAASLLATTLIYGATKAAVDHVTRMMALELAPHKIRVNSIRPGMIRTEMTGNWTPEQRQLFNGPPFKAQPYNEDFIEPEHVANTVVFLSSSLSDMITGVTLPVDAGYLLF